MKRDKSINLLTPCSILFINYFTKKEEMEKVNLADKLSLIYDYWNPRIAGELNGQQVKLVKFKGPFEWHHHENEDELFYVVKGSFDMVLIYLLLNMIRMVLYYGQNSVIQIQRKLHLV